MGLDEQSRIELLLVLQQSLSEQYNFSPYTAKSLSSYILKTILSIIGGSSGLPILNAARKYANDNIALESLYSYGFIVALGAVNMWGLFDFIKYADIESKLNIEKSYIKNIAKVITAVTLAILTSIPMSFNYYHYNLSFWLTLQGFTCDVILLSSTYQRIFNVRYQNPFNINIKNNKNIIILQLLKEHIKAGMWYLATTSNEEKSNLFKYIISDNSDQDINNIINFDLAKTKNIILQVLQYGNDYIIRKEKHLFWYDGTPRNFVKIILSPLLPIVFAYVSYTAAVIQITEAFNNPILSNLLTLPSVILNYILETILTKVILLFIYDTIISFATKSNNDNISWVFYPRCLSIVSIWGLFTAAFSFSARAQLTKDFIPSPINNFLIPFVISVTILLKSSSLQLLIYDFFNYLIERIAPTDIKNVLKLNSSFEKLYLALEISSNSQLNDFMQCFTYEELIQCSDPDTRLNKLIVEQQQNNEAEPANIGNEMNNGFFSKFKNLTIFRYCAKQNKELLAEETENESIDIIESKTYAHPF